MPTFFHGTGLNDAQVIVQGQIDVTLSGGEFGQGFYMQYSKRHALTWAYRRGNNINGAPCVVQIVINDLEYGLLINPLYIDDVAGPALTTFLESTNQKYTFIHGNRYNSIEGPIMGNTARTQQKLEGQQSQDLLNGPNTTRTVAP